MGREKQNHNRVYRPKQQFGGTYREGCVVVVCVLSILNGPRLWQGLVIKTVCCIRLFIPVFFLGDGKKANGNGTHTRISQTDIFSLVRLLHCISDKASSKCV
mmetsp:Transcript_10960/g.13434  ORF Transcript_10960/g.13434 Transcript_10960/m.13434 type:complete len:102 (-) Transcript_10960:3-308(-)